MAALAGACAAGCVLAAPGSPLALPLWAAPLLLAALVLPILPWRRPGPGAALVAGAAAGALLSATAWRHGDARCLAGLADQRPLVVTGYLEAPPSAGRGELRVEAGLGSGCQPAVGLRLPPDMRVPDPGAPVRVRGVWLASANGRGWIRATRLTPVPGAPVRTVVALRGWAVATLHHRFGALGPLAAALVVARREGLDPALRDAFVRSGTAHLLAISGFHVGVIAALLYTLLRLGGRGLSRRRGGLVAAALVWGYVLVIGAPDAAARAALVLTLGALAAARGRPAAGEGALATALLLLALADPAALLRPGAQLSFAGAWGLVRWGPPVEVALRRALPPRLGRSLASPVAAGTAATLATLPVVAWHFQRLSLVGVPATLVAGPLVALAVPGLLATLLAQAIHPAAGAFVAGGVDVILALLVRVVRAWAAFPGASFDLPRSWSLTLAAGGVAAVLLLRARDARRWVRGVAAVAGAIAALELRPLALHVARSGTVEVVAVDVGQGDGILVRSPADRWLLVDAGPRAQGRDAGRDRILPYLKARGVRRLAAVVITHSDMDHAGGAAAVLSGVPVDGVLDPGAPRGSAGYLDDLRAARRAGVGWWKARAGASYELDGLRIDVLGPDAVADTASDANGHSVVLLLRWGAFSALLTGDAPADEEERVERGVGPVDLLKVAHHGSGTSSPVDVVDRLRPAVALVSVGRHNRYGHPDPRVVARLGAAGARVLRTDLLGTVSVVAAEDGTLTVREERPEPPSGGPQ